MEVISKKHRFEWELPLMLLVMLAGYVLLHDLLGGTLLAHSDWDSYTLQALAWREGRTWLLHNYEWLELAIYNGRYFVSFPPLPSLFILPLTFIFGENTPNNLLMIAYALITAGLCYAALRRAGRTPGQAALLAFCFVWGSNMLWMSTNGGVWFQAQLLCMLLLTGAVCAALYNRRVLAYALTALAVGCRPFAAVAFLPLFLYFYRDDRQLYGKGFWRLALAQAKCLIIPAVIAAAYMWYNYIRFDNLLEFGHNYLPEFTESEHGQFYLGYIPQNLYNIFIRPVTLQRGGRLQFSYFDGFMFYIANPIFIVWFIWIIRDLIKRSMDTVKLGIIAAVFLMLLLLCAHKTFGGWQFGARYTVDALPLLLLYFGLKKAPPRSYEYALLAFGVMFNVYGTLMMTYAF